MGWMLQDKLLGLDILSTLDEDLSGLFDCLLCFNHGTALKRERQTRNYFSIPLFTEANYVNVFISID